MLFVLKVLKLSIYSKSCILHLAVTVHNLVLNEMHAIIRSILTVCFYSTVRF